MEHPTTFSIIDATMASTPSVTCVTPSTDELDHTMSSQLAFSLIYNNIEYTTLLSTYVALELSHYRTVFLSSLQKSPSDPTESPSSAESILIRFFKYLIDNNASKALIAPLLASFQKDFLIVNDIHSVIASLPEPKEAKRALICSYYATMLRCNMSPEERGQRSALFKQAEKGSAKLMAVFGGQGASNLRCVKDLQDVYEAYTPFLETLVELLDSTIYELCLLPDTYEFFKGREIRLRSWLKNSNSVPNEQFVAAAPVSFVIHGAIALAHWCVLCKVLGKDPGGLRPLIAGITGHSQGVVIAAVISGSNSWSSFYENAVLAMKVLFWIGYEGHHAAPRDGLSSIIIQEARDEGEGHPSPMVYVSGLSANQINNLITKCNQDLQLAQKVYLALSNSRSSYTVAGPASSLIRFTKLIREIATGKNTDQSRIPFDKRKPDVQVQFLPISAPYHSPHLELAARRIKHRLSTQNLKSKVLGIPVYNTKDGSNLATSAESDVLPLLVDAVILQPVDWPATLNSPKYTHVLAFGKSLIDMIANNTDGKGVKIISATEMVTNDAYFGTKCDMFATHLPDSFLSPRSWGEKFRPQLKQSGSHGITIQTKMTDILGLPPLMVAGMTPTTVHWDFVSVIMNAGYHVELAGGGYVSAESMSAAIDKLSQSIPPGRGITCNLIYASPQSMAWQIPMLRRLARTGRPIDGLTIGAGIPSVEIASEYISSLGLRHISFKPGSKDAIERVLDLAKIHSDFTIIIQWTGGRGGGHHSFEDIHFPILNLYGKIRQCSNVILVAGSGFGDASGTYPYLTGSWSSKLGYPPMPFDGILLGSRLMVAREAHTSQSVKQLICDAPGTDDEDWTASYSKPVGGIVTIQSEMGQPIHKIATRGVMFWKWMDENIFNLPRDKQMAAIHAQKSYIIRKLNEDFAKPWFGRNTAGDAVEVCEMTYQEIISRLISLMYLPHKGKWIDPSYHVLVCDFAVRALERWNVICDIANYTPENLEAVFVQKCPQASTAIMHPEDTSWFLKRCKRRGQKPVNFVPVLDENLSTWMKKDSLWQSENIEAVIDQDPGRVCVLQGPVAVQYSRQVNEPVADILDGINDTWIKLLRNDFYQNREVPVEDFWEPHLTPSSASLNVIECNQRMTIQAISGRPLPNREEFFQYLAHRTDGWMRAFFLSESILQGHIKRLNFLREAFELDDAKLVEVDRARSTLHLKRLDRKNAKTWVTMSSPDGVLVNAQAFHHHPGSDKPTVLDLQFRYDRRNVLCPLSEEMRDRNNRIKSFYSQLWLGSDIKSSLGLYSTFGGYRTVLSERMLEVWRASIGLGHSNDRHVSLDTKVFPLNATIVPSWEALVQPLMVSEVDDNLLDLIHLSIDFQLLPGSGPLKTGEAVDISSNIDSVIIEDSGKVVSVRVTISREDGPAVNIISKFMIRGTFTDFTGTFQRKTEPDMILKISSSIDDTVLRTRPWLKLEDHKVKLVEKTILFRVSSFCNFKRPGYFENLSVTGEVFIQDDGSTLHKIGCVDFKAAEAYGNPVVDFLNRKGNLAIERHELEQPGWLFPSTKTIKMPASNELYAEASKDYNPIHASPVFSTLADLPETIVHGMYTSAVTSIVLSQVTNDINHLRTRRYTVSFVDMVLPGEEIEVRYRHVAMIQGRMVIQIQALKTSTGEKVLEGEAELEQVPTTYIFTGQGSQAPGMGMELYKSSPVAKRVWDDIDRYLLANYGWSILKIVRENPKRLTIRFTGKRGRAIRDNYIGMAVQSIGEDGQTVSTPLLPDLTQDTQSFTFEDPRGLLYATQFAQPAIAILEKATFEDMRSRGLVQQGAMFAGHSLGEFGALACLVDYLPFHHQMDIAFYRGLTMQSAVERDENGLSDFSMMAVNPARVNKRAFNESALRRIVCMITEQSRELLEIVNFNVEGEQYVCTGHNANLSALTEILNSMSRMTAEQIGLWVRESSTSRVDENEHSPSTAAINSLIKTATKSAHELPKSKIVLLRGEATIPLQGIDVPFHSSHLKAGVAAWRKFLLSHIRQGNIQLDQLLGKFVPNVMGRPFSLEREYIEEAARVTQSEPLKILLGEGTVH